MLLTRHVTCGHIHNGLCTPHALSANVLNRQWRFMRDKVTVQYNFYVKKKSNLCPIIPLLFSLFSSTNVAGPITALPSAQPIQHSKQRVTRIQYSCCGKTNYICTLQGWDTWKIQQCTSTGWSLQSGLHRPNKDPGAPSCIGYHSLTTGFHLSGKNEGGVQDMATLFPMLAELKTSAAHIRGDRLLV